MRLLFTLIAISLGLFASTGLATESEKSALFTRLDADFDGQLTKAEIPAEHSALFRRLVRHGDADGDGRLSLSEFESSLINNRPEKVATEKVPNELPGADALLLMLAWMDRNGDLSIAQNEVPSKLKPLYDQFIDLINLPDNSRLPVPQLRQQAGRYGLMAQRFANRQQIDVEVELALLTEAQWGYVERLKSSLRPGSMMENHANAEVVFAQLDRNGDGKISLDELPPPLAERLGGLWERADRDGDKQLNEREFMVVRDRITAMQSGRETPGRNRQGVRQLLRRADRDGDGKLSREEAPPRLVDRFDSLDQNGDGQLSGKELNVAAENLASLRNSTGNRLQEAPSSDASGNKPDEK